MNAFGKFWWVVYVLAILSLVMGIYASTTSSRQVSLGSWNVSDSHFFTLSMAFFLWAISISSAQPTGYLNVGKM